MRNNLCPAGHKLLRIGGEGDGAYLVPDDLTGITSCYSPGVSNKKLIEDELLEKFDIGRHICDFTSDAEKLKTPLKSKQTFAKKWPLFCEGLFRLKGGFEFLGITCEVTNMPADIKFFKQFIFNEFLVADAGRIA